MILPMRLTKLLIFLLVLLTTATHAQIPASEDRDFALCLRVNGYEPDTNFLDPTGLALDNRSGTMYIADAKDGTVSAFSLQGVPKSRYGFHEELKNPLALAVDKQGNLYVSETDGGPIKIISPKGEVTKFELPTEEGAKPPKPGRMTFDRDGSLYVVDRENNRILVFDKDRQLKLKIGGTGDKRGQFKKLEDVAVDRQGRIYALDSTGYPVQVFDKKGKYLYRFGYRGEGDEDISFPAGLFVDQNDQVWIVDRGQHALKVFDRSGQFLHRFGVYGLEESMLFQPIDADMDSFGRVYILEAGARRLQVFSLSRPFQPLAPSGL